MKFLTIDTPTYNRDKSLIKLYQSLMSQTYKDFVWFIVDDGSIDETQEIVETFKDIDKVYFFKPNGGKHTALNFIRKYITSQVFLVVDSDDYLDVNAVKIIKDNWIRYSGSAIISHWYLPQDIISGDIVGKKFKKDVLKGNYKDVVTRSKMGDKRAVYDSSVFKTHYFPNFKGEKFLAESTFHLPVSYLGQSYFFNIPIYIGEYQKDGLTNQGKKLQLNNPKGALFNTVLFINSSVNLRLKIKKMILFNIYTNLSKNSFKDNIKKVGYRWMIIVILLYPFSLIIQKKWGKKYLNESV